MEHPALEAIHAYYRTFSTLDLPAIARHYTEPCMSTSATGVFTVNTRAELASVFSATTETLKTKGYIRSEFINAEVFPLNPTAAIVKGTALRRMKDGEERVAISYLMYKAPEAHDWKIAIIVL